MNGHLQRLKVALEAGRPVPNEVARWLLDGLEDYATNGGTLCAHLGLRENWGAKARRRNKALTEAAAKLSFKPISTWERAGRLAEAIRRGEVRIDCGIHIPRTQRQLYDIIR